MCVISKAAPAPSMGRRIMAGGADMTEVLSTIGVIVLFLAVFGLCILWATHGHPGDADNEDLSVVAKDH
jgi:multisubunit Na+/H+ antiporter MnhB subunit